VSAWRSSPHGAGSWCSSSTARPPAGRPGAGSFPFAFAYPYTTSASRTRLPRSIMRVSIATIRTRSGGQRDRESVAGGDTARASCPGNPVARQGHCQPPIGAAAVAASSSPRAACALPQVPCPRSAPFPALRRHPRPPPVRRQDRLRPAQRTALPSPVMMPFEFCLPLPSAGRARRCPRPSHPSGCPFRPR
jgi:hypothetical protein